MHWVCLIRDIYKMCRAVGPPGQVWEALIYRINRGWMKMIKYPVSCSHVVKNGLLMPELGGE